MTGTLPAWLYSFFVDFVARRIARSVEIVRFTVGRRVFQKLNGNSNLVPSSNSQINVALTENVAKR